MKSEDVGSLLEIVTMTWQVIDEERRSEIELDQTIIEGEFFRNVGEGETNSSKVAQGNLLFLAQEKLGTEIASPTKLAANNTRHADTSDAFETFNSILKGETKIEDSQAISIANRAIDSALDSHWIIFGKEHRGHEAVLQIVLKMFSGADLPRIKLKSLLSHFSYLNELFTEEGMTDILSKFAGRLKDVDVEELTLQDLPKGLLKATHAVGNGQWDVLHSHVEHLLKSVVSDAWPEHIANMDHTVAILIEKLGSSGCELDGGRFRKPFVKMVKDVLGGTSTIEAREGSLDILLTAIDESYHEDIWRTLREEVTNVTAETLEVGMGLFPKLIANIAHRGDRIMKAEKDNVIRQLLIPALEGRHSAALRVFIGMGYSKLKDFQNAAETSTKNMLEGAWRSFSEDEKDRDLIRSVSEAIYGVRKTKSIFDPSFWFPIKS